MVAAIKNVLSPISETNIDVNPVINAVNISWLSDMQNYEFNNDYNIVDDIF